MRPVNLVYVSNDAGHRREYVATISEVLAFEPMTARNSLSTFLRLTSADKLVFATIDDGSAVFVITAVLRALMRRRTVGLLLRPHSCFARRNVKSKVKQLAFRCIRRFASISVMTIVPFSVDARFEQIAKDGLVDPQMWDKYPALEPRQTAFGIRLLEAANGRRVLAYIGDVREEKGIRYLSQLVEAENWPTDDVLIVVAGRVQESVRHMVDSLRARGSLVIDRFLTDDELESIYASADVVWACYAEQYDQSSGIFGRAVQYQKLAVVRPGSTVDKLCQVFGLAALRLDELPELRERLIENSDDLEMPNSRRGQLVAEWRNRFVEAIKEAVG